MRHCCNREMNFIRVQCFFFRKTFQAKYEDSNAKNFLMYVLNNFKIFNFSSRESQLSGFKWKRLKRESRLITLRRRKKRRRALSRENCEVPEISNVSIFRPLYSRSSACALGSAYIWHFVTLNLLWNVSRTETASFRILNFLKFQKSQTQNPT